MRYFRQNGVVLVIALMVLAVVATLSVYTLKHVDRSVSMVTFSEMTAQQRQHLLGGEAWASAWVSQNDKTADKSGLLDLKRPWHLKQAFFSLEEANAHLKIDVIERQACININLLADSKNVAKTEARLMRLSQLLSLPNDWISLTKDWLDDDQSLSAINSHEDEFYLGLDIPFRTSDSAIVDVSELALLPISTSTLTSLAPYICWLPEVSTINVNQLTEPLITGFLPDLNDQAETSLIARLSSSGFSHKDDFLAWAQTHDVVLEEDEWSVESQFFDVFVTLSQEGHTRYLHSRIKRLENGQVVAFSRSFAPFHVLSKVLMSPETTTSTQ